MTSHIIELDTQDWNLNVLDEADKVSALAALEAGNVLHFPKLGFALQESEQRFLNPAVRTPKARNISLNAQGKLKGVKEASDDAALHSELAQMIGRFREHALGLIQALAPPYQNALRLEPTSYRPMQVETRRQSVRADDRRLHVDAFPSRPNYGERILRVFANINPVGVPRIWRIGEPFEDAARRFLPRLGTQWPGSAWLLNALRITKTRRSAYDHLMLGLHDAMKTDEAYQRTCPQQTVPFAPNSVWVCFSDQTSHAVMSGQYLLEQTFFLPPHAMQYPEYAPLAILERLTGRTLV
jgi:hypothetical protein